MGLFLSLGLFQRSDLRFSEQQALLGALGVGSRPPSWFGNFPGAPACRLAPSPPNPNWAVTRCSGIEPRRGAKDLEDVDVNIPWQKWLTAGTGVPESDVMEMVDQSFVPLQLATKPDEHKISQP